MSAEKRSNKPTESGAEATPATFDERLARLETIVADLEQGKLGLEGSIERYQEGVQILAQCQALLAGYRKRVEELSAGTAATLTPYAGDPDVAGDSRP
jgi:exodeoxyribonuclease VII small subunit